MLVPGSPFGLVMCKPKKVGGEGSASVAKTRGSAVTKTATAQRRRATSNKSAEAPPDAPTVPSGKVPGAPKSKAEGKARMDEVTVVPVSGPLLRPHVLRATALCEVTSLPSYVRLLRRRGEQGGGL